MASVGRTLALAALVLSSCSVGSGVAPDGAVDNTGGDFGPPDYVMDPACHVDTDTPSCTALGSAYRTFIGPGVYPLHPPYRIVPEPDGSFSLSVEAKKENATAADATMWLLFNIDREGWVALQPEERPDRYTSWSLRHPGDTQYPPVTVTAALREEPNPDAVGTGKDTIITLTFRTEISGRRS